MDDRLDVTALGMAAGGDALARAADGRVVFVAGALPGERVRARVVAAKRDFLRTVVEEVLEPSPDRVATGHEPCLGCTWRHVAPAAQPALKVGIVLDALRRIAAVVEVPVVARPAGERSLRTTVRLGVDPATGRLGERRPGGAEVVVASEDCPALHPLLREVVVEGRFPGAGEVVLRVGVASGERGGWVADGRPAAGPGSFVVPPDGRLAPDAVVHEEVAGAWLRVSIGSFFQPGPVAAAELVAAVSAAIGDDLAPGGHLLDAYAGVGLFGATVGRRGRVTAVETSAPAVADAAVNLAAAGVDGAEVVRSEVGRWRPSAAAPAVDVVVADPARTGLGRPGAATVSATGAPRLVLVSCDPASLARDVKLLAADGWELQRVELVDAFPDTFHVEAVARFDRA